MTAVMSEPIPRPTISLFLSLYKHTGINYNKRSFLQLAYSMPPKSNHPQKTLSRHKDYKTSFTVRENTQLIKSCVLLCSVLFSPAFQCPMNDSNN